MLKSADQSEGGYSDDDSDAMSVDADDASATDSESVDDVDMPTEEEVRDLEDAYEEAGLGSCDNEYYDDDEEEEETPYECDGFKDLVLVGEVWVVYSSLFYISLY